MYTREADATWSEQSYLKARYVDMNDYFGWSVAIDGEEIAIGAMHENGDGSSENNTLMFYSGAASIFRPSVAHDSQMYQYYVKCVLVELGNVGMRCAPAQANQDSFWHKIIAMLS